MIGSNGGLGRESECLLMKQIRKVAGLPFSRQVVVLNGWSVTVTRTASDCDLTTKLNDQNISDRTVSAVPLVSDVTLQFASRRTVLPPGLGEQFESAPAHRLGQSRAVCNAVEAGSSVLLRFGSDSEPASGPETGPLVLRAASGFRR